MKMCTIDTEQEAILRATLSGVASFLKARSFRRDPFRVISRAADLQERKCANLLFQLDQPPICGWQQVKEPQREHFRAMVKAMADAKTPHFEDVMYSQIFAFITSQRAEPDPDARLVHKQEAAIT